MGLRVREGGEDESSNPLSSPPLARQFSCHLFRRKSTLYMGMSGMTFREEFKIVTSMTRKKAPSKQGQ